MKTYPRFPFFRSATVCLTATFLLSVSALAQITVTTNHFDQSPLTVTRDAAGLHAALDRLPLDLKGWTIVVETSTDLQTWTPAPASSTTATPNPDSTTERVSVLLPAVSKMQVVRLKAIKP